jgi:Uma2 family endonuclease
VTQLQETDLGLWRFSVDKYHELIESGVLDEDAPVELLEGWLVEKMSKNPPHTLATTLVRRFFENASIAGTLFNLQEPITLSTSEPEPDLSLIRGHERDYAHRHPYPTEVILVVEIADASLKRDSTWKKRVYASAGIAQYWILNLKQRQLEVYTAPQLEEYTSQRVYSELETAEVTLEGQVFAVAVRDLLP